MSAIATEMPSLCYEPLSQAAAQLRKTGTTSYKAARFQRRIPCVPATQFAFIGGFLWRHFSCWLADALIWGEPVGLV